jgi:hypothetical protein
MNDDVTTTISLVELWFAQWSSLIVSGHDWSLRPALSTSFECGKVLNVSHICGFTQDMAQTLFLYKGVYIYVCV